MFIEQPCHHMAMQSVEDSPRDLIGLITGWPNILLAITGSAVSSSLVLSVICFI
jgi:hypothetical protein